MVERAVSLTILALLVAPLAAQQPEPPLPPPGSPPASGASSGGGPEKTSAQSSSPKEGTPARTENLRRWEKLSPEARERLKRIYQRLESLPPAERRALLESLRGMNAADRRQAIEKARERVQKSGATSPPQEGGAKGVAKSGAPSSPTGESGPPAAAATPPRAEKEKGSRAEASGGVANRLPYPRLSPEERRRLQALPPRERQKELERLLEGNVERWVERLPPPMRARVKTFTRRERMDFFRAYHESDLLRRVFREESEIDALQRLPAGALRPTAGTAAGSSAEHPPSISEESWERWKKLLPRDRNRVLRRLDRLREESAESQK